VLLAPDISEGIVANLQRIAVALWGAQPAKPNGRFQTGKRVALELGKSGATRTFFCSRENYWQQDVGNCSLIGCKNRIKTGKLAIGSQFSPIILLLLK